MNTSDIDWQPDCSLEMLRLRAQLLSKIRCFFAERSVLEVETPLLCRAVGTDPNLDFFTASFNWPPHFPQLYLQTSPEFAMKRLLAAGSGSIYQIAKAFRNGEAGRLHNPEFTLLEWYREGFDLARLMAEIEELMREVFGRRIQHVVRISYVELFKRHTGLDCLQFDAGAYADYANASHLPDAVQLCGENHALWLDFLFSHCVQPNLTEAYLYLVYGYPACLPSLARNNQDNPQVTERVEVFMNGIELGNGYHELSDRQEQERRFDAEIASRAQRHLPPVNKDVCLLAALEAGLPDCAGMAIGLDRLLMLLSGSASIEDVLAFPVGKA